MSAFMTIIGIAIAFAALMAIAWRVVIITGNAGWVDVFWSGGIGLGGAAAALVPVSGGPPNTGRALLAAGLVLVWALRLGGYILGRTLRGGSDPRYDQLREAWGTQYESKLLGFFEIQALAGVLLVLAVMAAARSPGPLGWSDQLGLAIGVVAIAGEAVSDAQMRAFKRDPSNKGKICDTGLWGLSRHPNYFFEWLAWVAYLPIGLRLTGDYPCGWATLIAPLMTYWLLVRVSGIPPLEAHLLRSRPEAFRAYRARVRPFWPLPKFR